LIVVVFNIIRHQPSEQRTASSKYQTDTRRHQLEQQAANSKYQANKTNQRK